MGTAGFWHSIQNRGIAKLSNRDKYGIYVNAQGNRTATYLHIAHFAFLIWILLVMNVIQHNVSNACFKITNIYKMPLESNF